MIVFRGPLAVGWAVLLSLPALAAPIAKFRGAVDHREDGHRQQRRRQLDEDVPGTYGAGYFGGGWDVPDMEGSTTTATTETTPTTASFSFQPRVTVVEGLPSRCGVASISNPAGTPWCQGAPTYWITGHQNVSERPRCLQNGSWVVSNTTELNNTKDRHFCVTMDVNKDGADDIICNVGALKGRGMGYNELWITDPVTGSVTQLLNASSPNKRESPSGLQKYPTMRNRVAATLRNSVGERKFVFMGTLGTARSDGLSDRHRMFKNVYSAPTKFPYFVEVPGPWTRQLFPATWAVAGDFSGDGVDDLVICNAAGTALLARQVGTTETFVNVNLQANHSLVQRWYKARLADVTGDGRKDLVVVAGPVKRGAPPYLAVFYGIRQSPFFYFLRPYYRRVLPFAPYDVEVLDVNKDGKADIYVVQTNDTKGSYCGPQGRVVRLPDNVVPPLDTAPDLLLVGATVGAPLTKDRFQVVTMAHAQPGCGAIAERWDHKTMLLSQGSFDNSGYQLLLEW